MQIMHHPHFPIRKYYMLIKLYDWAEIRDVDHLYEMMLHHEPGCKASYRSLISKSFL